MIACRIVDFLTALLPWRLAADTLRLRHAERCPACGERLLSKGEAGSLICKEQDVGSTPEFWPAVMRRIGRRGEAASSLASARLAAAPKWAALAGTATLAAAAFLIIRGTAPRTASTAPEGPPRFELGVLKFEGKSVTPVVIQPEGSDLIIVWAGIDR